MFDSIHEECGVFGIWSKDVQNVALSAYYALFSLQHRGQESAGIVVNEDGVMTSFKDVGLVDDIFTKDRLAQLDPGNMAIGHVRYGMSETRPRLNAQPLLVNHIKGSMALAYNGSLTNADILREQLELSGSIFHTTGDIEVISYVITKERLTAPSIEQAVVRAMPKLKGAYSLVVMSPTKLIGARDPLGFRPLCIGRRGDDWVLASESCALDSIGAEFVRDVEPGEVVVINSDGLHSDRTNCTGQKKAHCIFEYIYFARPDSVIDGTAVHEARKKAGAFLAQEHPVDADVVVGVPDSGIDAALGYAEASGIPYGIGFIKNKYIGRTFIQPTQAERETAVRIKLNPISSVVEGKRVVMIDDSIVRGTTSARIVGLLREAGAKEVHMRVSSPPFMHPCYFGTDISSTDHLIACHHTLDEICKIIGVDSLGYLSVENLVKIGSLAPENYCCACFNGKYPTEIPKRVAQNRFERKLSERTDKKS